MQSKPMRPKTATRQIVTTPSASASTLVRGITQKIDSTHALCQHGCYTKAPANLYFQSHL
ncbi:hypothetical protein Hanom_Chr10g00924111 [Helianthus anomalus]